MRCRSPYLAVLTVFKTGFRAVWIILPLWRLRLDSNEWNAINIRQVSNLLLSTSQPRNRKEGRFNVPTFVVTHEQFIQTTKEEQGLLDHSVNSVLLFALLLSRTSVVRLTTQRIIWMCGYCYCELLTVLLCYSKDWQKSKLGPQKITKKDPAQLEWLRE